MFYATTNYPLKILQILGKLVTNLAKKKLETQTKPKARLSDKKAVENMCTYKHMHICVCIT